MGIKVTLLSFLFGVSAIAQNCGYVIEETITTISCNNSCDGIISVEVSGGDPPYVYTWNNAETVSSISNLCQGTYVVTITGSTGCDSIFTATEIINPDPLYVNAIKIDIFCGSMGSVSANAYGGNGSYMYLFTGYTDSIGNPSFADLSEGSYTLSVGDRSGCGADTTVFITEVDCVEPLASEAFSPNGDGINEIWSIANMDLFPNSSVHVYDRWGQKVFESQGYIEQWNGQGVFGTVPAASYYYVIILDDTDKGGQVVKGSVAVVR